MMALPPRSAPVIIATESATGKLNGAITAKTPCGRSTQRVASEGAAHRAVVTAVRRHLVAIVADEVDRLLDLADRLHARLADLEQAGAGDLVFLALDALGGAAQRRHALGPGAAAP